MIVSRGEKIFSVFNYITLSIVGFLTLYPFWYVLIASISSGDAVISGRVLFFPKEVTLFAYEEVFKQKGLWISYANTIFYVVTGTAVSLLLTILAAYPLSKKRLKGRSFFTFFFAFSMWFGAGTIPIYLNFKDLGLLNTRLSMIIGFAISTFYVIILRTFFQGIPESLEESAKIDGADDFYILWKLYLPLSKPAILTLLLYYAVNKWNGYFWAMVLLQDENKIPLQVLLRKLVVDMQGLAQNADVEAYATNKETITYATIMVSILPIIAVYPYIQKYFVSGMVVGAVKG